VPDLTPLGADIQALPALVQAGIMTTDEARAWIDLPQLSAQLAKAAGADLDADVAAALLAAMRAPGG
jgi:ABC-type nitrate/sulfonate/bicarbonate transport system substrate-binding protein